MDMVDAVVDIEETADKSEVVDMFAVVFDMLDAGFVGTFDEIEDFGKFVGVTEYKIDDLGTVDIFDWLRFGVEDFAYKSDLEDGVDVFDKYLDEVNAGKEDEDYNHHLFLKLKASFADH